MSWGETQGCHSSCSLSNRGLLYTVNSIAQLSSSIEERKILRAREASIEEKLLDGPRLFRLSCEAVKAGLRLDYPEADEERIHELLIERVYGKK